MYDRCSVGSIEVDKYLQGGSMAMLGIVSFILALYSQTLYSEGEIMYYISELHMGGVDCDYKLMDSTDC